VHSSKERAKGAGFFEGATLLHLCPKFPCSRPGDIVPVRDIAGMRIIDVGHHTLPCVIMTRPHGVSDGTNQLGHVVAVCIAAAAAAAAAPFGLPWLEPVPRFRPRRNVKREPVEYVDVVGRRGTVEEVRHVVPGYAPQGP